MHLLLFLFLLVSTLSGLLLSTPAFGEPRSHAMSDAAILGELANIHSSQIAQGQLALALSSDPRARGFAASMGSEHGVKLAELRERASSLGIALPSELDPARVQAIRSLGLMRGSAFDDAYLRIAGEQEHRRILRLLELAAQSRLAALRVMASASRPAAQMHLGFAHAGSGRAPTEPIAEGWPISPRSQTALADIFP